MRYHRLIGPAFGIAAVLMLPWLALLARTLPTSASAHNWSTAWVGFDVLLAAGLATTGWYAWRRDRAVILPATATGTLLIADAWFDVLTSAPGADFLQALVLAVGCELPVAACCLTLAIATYRGQPRRENG